jgi:hypothetical protein
VFRIVLPLCRLGQLRRGADATAGEEPTRVPDKPIPRSRGTKTAGLCEVNLPVTAASAGKTSDKTISAKTTSDKIWE